ncbi:MAG: PEP-CTERM sorting domain-containing protein [Verrucomicrobiae bacterium]|nr:PEP-CTERM sorting domain-containing protein [Verrucomicrobiae bacterium]
MTFTPINLGDQFGRMGGGRSAFPENGSAYLILAAFDSLSGSRGGVSRFGLHSVDLSEFSILYQFSRTVQFVGYRADGGVVTTEFTTDGIMDGTGPLPDFETFYFDDRFFDLVRFEVPSHTYALDNLVFFDVIPEPSTGALVLLGATILGFRLLRRKRRAS